MHGEILLSVGRLKRVRALDRRRLHHDGRGRPDAGRGAGRGRRRRPAVPAQPAVRGQLPDRRQPRHQRRRRRACWPTATRASWCSGSRWCWPTGASGTASRASRRTTRGYDLKDLFIGSEGTLGIITAAVLKLFPKPAEKATAFVALPDLDTALALFGLAQERAGHSLTAFEVMAGIVLDLVLKHVPGARDPFPAKHPWYALLETSGLKADGAAERLLTEALQEAAERDLIVDAAIAGSLAQARDFWRLREVLFGGAEARGRQHQERRLRAGRQDPRVHRPRRRRGRAPLPRRAARAARAFRRRQRALQHRPAGRHVEAGVPGAVG